jgi:hypothetical protein
MRRDGWQKRVAPPSKASRPRGLPRVIPIRDELVDAYRAATAVYAELEMLPRWAWRRRRRLEADVDRLAAVADRLRAERGAPLDAPGLREVLDDVRGRRRR